MGTYVAFVGNQLLAEGPLAEVALRVLQERSPKQPHSILVFHLGTGEQIDLDLRGGPKAVALRYAASPAVLAESEEQARSVGRPKLGVVGKEVTLLPRQWEWLSQQPGGPSVTLRKLIDDAKRAGQAQEEARNARDAAYRFMRVMAGNQRGFEEALRALYQGNRKAFQAHARGWPPDVHRVGLSLAEKGWNS